MRNLTILTLALALCAPAFAKDHDDDGGGVCLTIEDCTTRCTLAALDACPVTVDPVSTTTTTTTLPGNVNDSPSAPTRFRLCKARKDGSLRCKSNVRLIAY